MHVCMHYFDICMYGNEGYTHKAFLRTKKTNCANKVHVYIPICI